MKKNNLKKIYFRRSSPLAAASNLAFGCGGDRKSSLVAQKTTNTQMVNVDVTTKTEEQPTSNANDLLLDERNRRWMATFAPAAEDAPCTFPEKLMSVLENDQLSDIITWLPHGRSFIILQKERFTSEVMPLYFEHSKFVSFTRKLNHWGFARVPRGPESGSYYHEVRV